MKMNNFALIIGAMKCGTTSLFNYLAQHPQISPCSYKEPLFFCVDRQYKKGFNYYQNLWNWNNRVHKVALESTVGYTRVTHPSYMNAAKNIAKIQAETGANFKFIYIMRDPIVRIESHYTQGRKHQHKDTAKPLSQGIQQEIIDTSRYAMQLEEYYTRFPSQNILLLNFEFFKEKPLSILKQVCKFLDLDQTYPFQKLDVNYNQYTSEINRVAIPGYTSIRNTELANSLVKEIPDGIKLKVKFMLNFLSYKVQNEYVKLSSEQKKYLLNQLEGDLKILREKYDFDLYRWNVK